MLRVGGATFALVSAPLVCACTTAALAFRATPATLLLAETLRKVTAYSLAKPARELLFTKVSSDARYKAKLVLDTVVQRGGDAIGAAVFSLLGALRIRWNCRSPEQGARRGNTCARAAWVSCGMRASLQGAVHDAS